MGKRLRERESGRKVVTAHRENRLFRGVKGWIYELCFRF